MTSMLTPSLIRKLLNTWQMGNALHTCWKVKQVNFQFCCLSEFVLRTNMSVFVWTSATNYFDVWPECYVCGMSLRIFSLKLFDLTLPCEILYNNYTAVLSRCIGDLSTLQCQGDSKSSPKTLSKVTDSCVRNPSEARKSLVNRATALDSYVGWIVASWMSFFRQSDERETHIVRSARPAAHDWCTRS